MPISYTVKHRDEILTVVAEPTHVLRLKSNRLDRNYFTDDDSNQRHVRPGLILAQETNTNKYVPYNASALYGVGSDTAVGVLESFEDATQEDPVVAPVVHGKVIEAHCYLWGEAPGQGTVPAAVKTSLDDIHWV